LRGGRNPEEQGGGWARVRLGEEGVCPRFGEERELLKIYEVVYETLLWLVLDSMSPILRVHDHLGSNVSKSIR
jgi:hypothetical protein